MAMISGKQFGNYRIVRLLGQGSFASVYLGKHQYLNSYAALKVLKISLSEKEVQRFQAEAQLLVNLKHPNIIRVLEFYVEQGVPVLVMEQAPEGTLRDKYPSGTRLPLATAVAYITQACAALQYAHNQNLIHRDVKPENMLLGLEDQLLLGDFGLALFTPSPEQLSTQGFAGTLPYTPPEQLRGKPSFASDQYALAIVAYEWLCGRRPFEGAYWELIQKQMYVEPPRLQELATDIPPSIEAVVLKALMKDDRERFVSIQAFAQALNKAYRESLLDEDDDADITTPLRAIGRPSIAVALPVPPAPTRVEPTVFLSAAPADGDIIARLRAAMQQQGITCLPDSAETATDMASLAQREAQVIRMVSAVVVVVSARTAASTIVQGHLSAARMYQKHLICLWVEGTTIAQILLDAWGQKGGIAVFDAKEARYTTVVEELITYLKSSFTINAQDSFIPTEKEELWEPRDPYKGLKAFTQEDVADFFGRDALIEQLMESVKDISSESFLHHTETRLLTVIGPSGSGKSSAVMAGLLPRLKEGALPGSMRWVYLQPLIPGAHPLEALLLTLAPHFPQSSLTNIHADLKDDAMRGLYLLAMQLRRASDTKVVLLIDQFEELFTLTASEQERQYFINLLVNAVTEVDSPLIVILTLRADFSDWPMHYPKLHQVIEAHRLPILPMSLDELRAVIEQPAMLPDVQLRFEGNLVGDLLFEVSGQVGALPLLAYTLDQLYQKREGHVLTTKAYQDIGGVKGALTHQAEDTYLSLPSEEHRRLAKVLFLRLINPGQNVQETTRRRTRLEELALQDDKATTIISAVADAFVKARLLTTNEVGGSTTIEVSHEALIREWKRLSEWLGEVREDVFLQQTISKDAEKWIQENRPVDELYTGTKLTKAQAWAERNPANRNEILFLQASAEEHQRRAEYEQQRLRRELNLKRQTVNRLYGLATALALLLIVSIIFAVLAQGLLQQVSLEKTNAIIAEKNANARALAANASTLLAQDRLDLALLLGIKATQTDPTSYEARNSLLNALEHSPQIITLLRSGQQQPLHTLLFNSANIVVAADIFNVYVWHLNTRGHPLFTLNQQPYIGAIALSSDQHTLAISNATGVWLWNIQTGSKIATLDASPQGPLPTGYEPLTALAFSPDGHHLASARCAQYVTTSVSDIFHCTQTRVSIWDTQSKQLLSQNSVAFNADTDTVTFSPDAQLLAFSSGTNAQVVQVATGQMLNAAFTCNTDQITSMAFSPNNALLACGSSTSIQIINVATGRASIPPLKGHTDVVSNLAFSPDGQKLVSSSLDHTIRLWDIKAGQLIGKPLTGDANGKDSIAFSPDGKTFVSGSEDGTILLWNTTAESPISQQLAITPVLSSPVFTPDGTHVYMGSTDGKVLLYDIKTGKLVDTLDTSSYPLLPQPNVPVSLRPIQGLALSRDGTTLVAGRYDGTVIVWNTSTKQSFALTQPQLLYQIALSADGQTLAVSEGRDVVTLWNVAARTRILTLPYHLTDSTRFLPIALSPNGKLLAVGGCVHVITDEGCKQGQIQLWNVATRKLVGKPLLGHDFTVFSLAFSPDGQTLASNSQDGVILWDVSAGKIRGHILALPTSSQGSYGGVLFSPKGTQVGLVGNQSLSFVLWSVARQELLADAISTDDTEYGSIAFSPDEQHLLSTSSLVSNPDQGVLMLWDIAPGLWQQHACAIANRDLMPNEWRQYVKNEVKQVKVCPALTS